MRFCSSKIGFYGAGSRVQQDCHLIIEKISLNEPAYISHRAYAPIGTKTHLVGEANSNVAGISLHRHINSSGHTLP